MRFTKNKVGKNLWIATALAAVFLPSSLWGQAASPEEIARLQQQVRELQERVNRLEKLLLQQTEVKTAPVPAASAVPAAAAAPAAETQPAAARNDLALYGTVDVTTVLDSSNNKSSSVFPGAVPFHSSDLSASASRIGLRYGGTTVLGARTGGRVEFDFLGGSDPSTPIPRLRHGYVSMEWADRSLVLTAGQTSDVVGPVGSDSIAFPSESYTGDLGSRRPLVSLSHRTGLGESFGLKTIVAVGKTYTHIDDSTLPADLQNLGVWVFQPAICLEFPAPGGQKGRLDLFGSYGRKSFTRASIGETTRLENWVFGGDFELPLGRLFTARGEIWRGVAQDLYRFSPEPARITDAAVLLQGGWASLTWTPSRLMRLNGGFGTERPTEQSGYIRQTARSSSFFWNLFYSLHKNMEIGVEASSWWSEQYRSSGIKDRLRLTGAAWYRF